MRPPPKPPRLYLPREPALEETPVRGAGSPGGAGLGVEELQGGRKEALLCPEPLCPPSQRTKRPHMEPRTRLGSSPPASATRYPVRFTFLFETLSTHSSPCESTQSSPRGSWAHSLARSGSHSEPTLLSPAVCQTSGNGCPEPPSRQPQRWGQARIGMKGWWRPSLGPGGFCARSLPGNPHGFRTSAAWLCWVGDTSGRWVQCRVGSPRRIS